MPKGKKKKFIDRKNAVTFHVVHRSQQDPLLVDETAPQHVLVAAPERKVKDRKVLGGEDSIGKLDEVIRKEREKYGVYFDDDYNYLQHLRERGGTEWVPAERPNTSKLDMPIPTKLPGSETRKLNLPSSVFASEFEEDVGLLNKEAPQSGLQLDLDPDVVAAMDPDFDFSDPDNLLEDDFIQLANGDSAHWLSDDDDDGSSGDYSSGQGYSDDDDDENDDVASLNGPQYTFAEEETKSRFTEYSMSSSVMRRNEQLSILDSRFENMFAGYDDSEIGALDCEEIEGHVAPDSDLLIECAEEFKRSRATERHCTDATVANRCLELVQDSGEGDVLDILEVPERAEEKWDCQSIVSTYSNIYNRPKVIAESKVPGRIRVSGRTGVPLDVLDDGKLTARALARLDAGSDTGSTNHDDGTETVMSTLSVLSIRPKDETPEDRRERKKALKEYRQERRLERKANTLAFKEEKKRQEKVLLNNMRNKQAVHIL